MSLDDLIDLLQKLLPIIGSMAGVKPEVAALIQHLVSLAEEEIDRRMAQNPDATRTEILADAAEAYAEARIENEKLKRLGHEDD